MFLGEKIILKEVYPDGVVVENEWDYIPFKDCVCFPVDANHLTPNQEGFNEGTQKFYTVDRISEDKSTVWLCEVPDSEAEEWMD